MRRSERPTARPVARTAHDDALHEAGRGGGGKRVVIVEPHGATVRQHPGGDGVLVGGEGELLRRLIGARLHMERPGCIRLQDGAIIHAPGGQHIDDCFRNRVQLAFRLCLPVGDAHQVVEDARLALPAGGLLRPFAQRDGQLAGQDGVDQEDEERNPLFDVVDDKGIQWGHDEKIEGEKGYHCS